MMNKYLQQLIELSSIDKEIDGFEPRIAEINKHLKEAESKMRKIDDEMLNYDDEIRKIKLEKAQNDLHIVEFNEKITELSKKSAAAKSEKEINALEIEEDIAKEQLSAANDEIIRLDKILENKENFKKELQQKKEELENSLGGINEDISVKMSALEDERKGVFERKNKLVADINHKVLNFYEKIRKWAKNTAVVPVKKQACYGCFMKIYDKTYLAVQKGDEIATCPHCGRILYSLEVSEPLNTKAVSAENAQENEKTAASSSKAASKSEASSSKVASKTAASSKTAAAKPVSKAKSSASKTSATSSKASSAAKTSSKTAAAKPASKAPAKSSSKSGAKK